MDAALKELAGHETRLKELGSGGEDTLRLLSETRAELNRVKAERNRMKEQLARGGGRSQARRRARASDSSDGSQTINALITSAGLKPGRGEREAAGDSNLKRACAPRKRRRSRCCRPT